MYQIHYIFHPSETNKEDIFVATKELVMAKSEPNSTAKVDPRFRGVEIYDLECWGVPGWVGARLCAYSAAPDFKVNWI